MSLQPLPPPNARSYDANNEAQTRRILELRLREMVTAIDAALRGLVTHYAIDGQGFSSTKDYASDGGLFTEGVPDLVFNAGKF